ncbi:MAG: dTMP kinase [Bacilli bacterium]|nr:dTMP kinase [Bacilli bacterium]
MFITFEGGEGAGKSTAIKRIVARLEEEGYEIVLTREPGGTPIAEEIRNVILDRKNTNMDPRTEALLYAASRRQHLVEKVIPALKEGKLVLCDRFLDSSLAYQGGARGLGIENVYNMNLFATEGMLPDLTILFDIEPELGLARIAANSQREVNRLDVEKMAFHKAVRQGFHDLAEKFPERFFIVDASKTPDEVFEAAIGEIERRLKK